MTERTRFSMSRKAFSPPPPSVSAFLWMGLLCLLVAGIVGTGTALTNSQEDAAVTPGWYIAFATLVCGFMLLLAHLRYPAWLQAAGLLEAQSRRARPAAIPYQAVVAARRRDAFLLSVLILLAAAPRVLALSHSLWYDELWTLTFMRGGVPYVLTHQEGYNNHLLNSLLGSLFWQAWAGWFHEDMVSALPPAWVVRLPAFLFGLASVPLLYVAVREHAGRPAAFAAAALLAFSPMAVDVSAQARGYTGMLFFAIAQTYYLSAALKGGAAAAWVGWLVCSVLGVFAHLYFLLVIATTLLFLFGLVLWEAGYHRDRARSRALAEQGALLFLTWAGLASVCYLGVWTILRANRLREAGTPPMLRAHEVLLPVFQRWCGVPSGDWQNFTYAACGALLLLGVWHLVRRGSGGAVYLPMLLLVPPLLVEGARPHFVYPRFFVFALPAFMTLLACGLWQVTVWVHGPKSSQNFWKGVTLGALSLGFISLMLPGLQEIATRPKQDFQRAVDRLEVEQAKGNLVAVIGTGSEFFSLYGLAAERPRDVEELRALLRRGKSVVVADTNLVVNPALKTSPLTRYVRPRAGDPLAVFPGRFAGWRYRWLDGASDITLYRLGEEEKPLSSPPRRSRRSREARKRPVPL